jgi:hypothetical protein
MLEPWVVCINHATTLKGLTAHTPNPFRVKFIFCLSEPRVLAMLEPWAEISQRLRRLIASTFGV